MSRIKSKKFTGVYERILKNEDITYSFTYKDRSSNKLKWVTVGKKSEGFNATIANNLRNEQISKMKHGKDITIIANQKRKHIPTLDDLLEIYVNEATISKEGLKKNIQRYNRYIKEPIGNKDIKSITPNDIENIMTCLKDNDLANKTINHAKSIVNTVFNNYLEKHRDNKIPIDNPCRYVKNYPVDNARDRYLEETEIEELREAVKDDFMLSLFVDISLITGARAGDVLEIKKKDINLDRKTINLAGNKTNSKYTGYLNDSIVKKLVNYLPDLKANDFIFNITYKTIADRLRPIFNNLFNKGLEKDDRTNRAVIYTLRHTFASQLAIKGTPIHTIKKLMNHRNINITMRYAKLSPDSGADEVREVFKW